MVCAYVHNEPTQCQRKTNHRHLIIPVCALWSLSYPHWCWCLETQTSADRNCRLCPSCCSCCFSSASLKTIQGIPDLKGFNSIKEMLFLVWNMVDVRGQSCWVLYHAVRNVLLTYNVYFVLLHNWPIHAVGLLLFMYYRLLSHYAKQLTGNVFEAMTSVSGATEGRVLIMTYRWDLRPWCWNPALEQTDVQSNILTITEDLQEYILFFTGKRKPKS